MNVRDTLERLFWTVIAAMGGNVAAGAVFDVDVLQAAAMAGCAAGVNFVLIVARKRLSVLPDPGEGLPGLELNVARQDAGLADVTIVALIVIAIIVVLLLTGHLNLSVG